VSRARLAVALAWLGASVAGALAGAFGCGSSGTATPPGDAGADATADAPVAPDGSDDAGADVLGKGARLLALDLNPAADDNYLNAFDLAREAGVQAVNVSIDWRDLESSADAGPDADSGGIAYFNPNLHIANLVFPGQAQVSLAFRAVDTTGPDVPPDLAGRPLDDPEVLARYNAAQDYVFGEIPDLTLSMYVLGNELDDALGTDAAKWAAYKTFFDGALAHAHALRPGVKVGATVTFAGATQHPELIGPTLQGADFLGITYNPVNADFTVRPVTDVRGDLDKLVGLYPTKPIYFRGAGYPSSPEVGSSLGQQAAFVSELFRAWDAHADRIPVMTFFTMNEYSPKVLAQLGTYYGSSDPKFLAFLGTLGLRTYSPGRGTDKPGWDALATGAHARGW
jgi:hypothetical protein